MSFHPTEPPASATEARFNEILASYGRFLRQAIVRACPRDLGLNYDEIEQDARLRLWKALESEREIQDLASYLYRIAVTVTLDAIRRVKNKREEQLITDHNADESSVTVPHHLMAAPSLAPDREAARKQLVQKVRALINDLPDNQRQAVSLHLTGMTTQEIADLLDWTEPKARNSVYRGLAKLRESLREAGLNYEIE